MAIKSVNLLPMLSSHKDFLLKAYQQKSIIDTGFITYDYPVSDIQIESIINNWLQNSDYNKCFVVERNGKVIGTAQITNINYINRTCEIGTLFLEEYQGQGAALSSALQLLEIAFNQLDIYKVIVRVQDTNTVVIKGIEAMGFTLEGTLREQVRRNGKRIDLHYYGLTQNEYYKNNYIKRYEKFVK